MLVGNYLISVSSDVSRGETIQSVRRGPLRTTVAWVRSSANQAARLNGLPANATLELQTV